MNPRRRDAFDFAVYDQSGRVAVLLEAKRRVGTDPSWAREWHETFAGRMAGNADAIILLVALDRLYGWRPQSAPSSLPDWTLDAREMLEPYFSRLRIEPTQIGPRLFEEVVGLWLRDVAQGKAPVNVLMNDAQDLISAIRNGEVVEQVAA